MRESPALDIPICWKRGAKVTYSDPFVPHLRADGVLPALAAMDSENGSGEADLRVVIVRPIATGFDYPRILERPG